MYSFSYNLQNFYSFTALCGNYLIKYLLLGIRDVKVHIQARNPNCRACCCDEFPGTEEVQLQLEPSHGVPVQGTQVQDEAVLLAGNGLNCEVLDHRRLLESWSFVHLLVGMIDLLMQRVQLGFQPEPL